MINVNELRIGNWVEDESHLQFQVEKIEKDAEGPLFINGRWIEDILPVKLTEEWLIRFGFVIEYNTIFYFYPLIAIKDNFFITKNTNGRFYSKFGNKRHIQYVHKLQNMFFEYINKDLTIIK